MPLEGNPFIDPSVYERVVMGSIRTRASEVSFYIKDITDVGPHRQALIKFGHGSAGDSQSFMVEDFRQLARVFRDIGRAL
jgi:hypothetical protein